MLIAATPKYLLVPPQLETLGEKVVSSIQATATADVNTFSFLSLIVEPRLTSATAWYLVGDPATIDGLEFAYLAGEEGPQLSFELGFAVDGISYKVREDFGCGWIEARGWWRQPGA
jgi:hypothetical protein